MSKRSAKKDSGKEKKDKDKGHGKKENKNHHSETCRVPYETIEDMKHDEADHCFKQEVSPPCHPHERYRRQDGSCNNPHFPTWGKSMTQIIRLASNTWNDSNALSNILYLQLGTPTNYIQILQITVPYRHEDGQVYSVLKHTRVLVEILLKPSYHI